MGGRPGSTLSLTVLGPAASWTRNAGEASSCYMVRIDGGAPLVLDLGQGAFSHLASLVEPEAVRAILVTHLHPDHCIDLVAYQNYLAYGPRPGARVELHGPSDLRRRFDLLAGSSDFLSLLPGDPLEPGTLRLDPFEVTVGRVHHIGESFAFRVVALPLPVDEAGPGSASAGSGRSVEHEGLAASSGIVYSGDCGDPGDLVALMRPGDTLLCEASFGAERAVEGPNHLDARLAARAAVDGRARALVLTHLLDGFDADAARAAASSLFPGPVLVAFPGLRVPVAQLA
jgi:ribonuclease BN (tRNA processing enzyme)